jgi:hypothetical protein
VWQRGFHCNCSHRYQYLILDVPLPCESLLERRRESVSNFEMQRKCGVDTQKCAHKIVTLQQFCTEGTSQYKFYTIILQPQYFSHLGASICGFHQLVTPCKNHTFIRSMRDSPGTRLADSFTLSLFPSQRAQISKNLTLWSLRRPREPSEL